MTSGCAETHTPLADDLLLMNINYVKADNSPQDFSKYVSTNVLKADALSGHTSRGGAATNWRKHLPASVAVALPRQA